MNSVGLLLGLVLVIVAVSQVAAGPRSPAASDDASYDDEPRYAISRSGRRIYGLYLQDDESQPRRRRQGPIRIGGQALDSYYYGRRYGRPYRYGKGRYSYDDDDDDNVSAYNDNSSDDDDDDYEPRRPRRYRSRGRRPAFYIA